MCGQPSEHVPLLRVGERIIFLPLVSCSSIKTAAHRFLSVTVPSPFNRTSVSVLHNRGCEFYPQKKEHKKITLKSVFKVILDQFHHPKRHKTKLQCCKWTGEMSLNVPKVDDDL